MREDESLSLDEEIQPKDLDIDIGIMHFSQPLSVHAEAYKSENDLTVQVRVSGEKSFACSSCLENFNNLFEKEMTLHYDIKGLDSVSIDRDVREEMILEHPIRVLCRPDCRGLCPQCGTNLNQEPCHCKV